MSSYIYHYTSLDVLALILENKTIRFNSLNRVDDLLDGILNDIKNASDYIFVSCWTDNEFESIPLWKMYSNDMNGIRIGIRKESIKPEYMQLINTDGNKIILTKNVKNITNKAINCFTDQFEIKVKYDDEASYKSLSPIMDENTTLREFEYTRLAEYKKICWEFQKEIRFVLLATLGSGDPLEDRKKGFKSLITNTNKPNVPFIDLKIDSAFFKDMKIMIGPKATPGCEIIVKALVEKYLPNNCICIEHSNLLVR